MAQKKPTRRKPAARKKPSARKPKEAAPEALEQVAPPEAAPEPALAPAEVPEDSAPEVAFAARMPEPEPERPRPTHRRAIFFDVENTSRAGDVAKLLEHVAIDRSQMATELVASGNWRVIGNETARLLARAGAHLVHSAPATGVRDWSDLRIAVAAGAWLASARPGDQLDIVSDDKAFDVVGDVAATLGVFFRRLSYRALLRGGRSGAAEPVERSVAAPAKAAAGGRRRRGGRGRSRPEPVAAAPEPSPTPEAVAPAEPAPEAEAIAEAAPAAAGAAPQDRLLDIIHELLQRSPNGVMLDVLANRLKAMGFDRPPGSPRLVTRVRGFKELDVSPRGLIRFRQGGGAGAPAASEEAPKGGNPEGRRRRRRGGGRGRGGGEGAPPTPAEG